MNDGVVKTDYFSFLNDPDISRRKKAKEIMDKLRSCGCLFDESSVPFSAYCPDASKLQIANDAMRDYPYICIDSIGIDKTIHIKNDQNKARREYAREILRKLAGAGFTPESDVDPLIVKIPPHMSPVRAIEILKNYPYAYAHPIAKKYTDDAPSLEVSKSSSVPQDAPPALRNDP